MFPEAGRLVEQIRAANLDFPSRFFARATRRLQTTGLGGSLLAFSKKMKKLNKAAIVILGKNRLVEWLRESQGNSILGIDYSLESVRQNSNVYLFDKGNFDEDVFEQFKEKYKEIANFEFQEWRPESAKWPKIDSFEEFLEWFDYEYHCTLLDTNERENKASEATA